MNTTDRLLAASKEIFDSYYEHPFVRGIRDGSLDHDKFRYYILQDYHYLIDYVRMFAMGAAKAPDVDTMKMFVDHCKAILDFEMNIHEGYMGKFGITEDELDNTPIALDNASYTAYMLRVAYEENAAAITAAIFACSISYEIIARRMIEDRPECENDEFYGRWIRDYSSDEYHRDNESLIDYTNRLTAGYTEDQYKHLEDIFINCARFETLFWDMGWEMRR